jgi:hypothetical protein
MKPPPSRAATWMDLEVLGSKGVEVEGADDDGGELFLSPDYLFCFLSGDLGIERRKKQDTILVMAESGT